MGDSKAAVEKNPSRIMCLLVIVTLAALLFSFTLGRYSVSLGELCQITLAKVLGLPVTWSETVEAVLFQVRLPRILAAMLVGAALSMAGAALQGMFRNPMVSPDILGASAGAGFGASLAILLSFSMVAIQIVSFFFGLIAVALTYTISNVIARRNEVTLTLVLTGMVISSLFASFISLIKYLADPYSKLPAITFWLMGSLTSITMEDLPALAIPFLLGAVPLFLLRWKLNILSFGEEEAKALGIETWKLRVVVIICATLMTAASVSLCGMIGWVGLIIPHLTRMLMGPNYLVLLPATFLIGSTYLLLVDNLARTLFAVEVPLGILTSLIGAPFFIYLLSKGKKGWV